MNKHRPTGKYAHAKFARVRRLSEIIGLPESTIWLYVSKGILPKPIKPSSRHTLFDVAGCIAALEEAGRS